MSDKAITPHLCEIPNDLPLLRAMIADAQSQPSIYKPGKYWLSKTKNARSRCAD